MPRPPRQTGDLFRARAAKDPALVPLAERMRPRTLDEVVGQEDLLGPGRVLASLAAKHLPGVDTWNAEELFIDYTGPTTA